MPFGFSNSPAVFQRFINAIFRDLTRRGIARPYVDDIIIPGKDETDAISNLKESINVCSSYGLALNLGKCMFLKAKVKFLGNVV